MEFKLAIEALPKLLSPLGIFGFALICCTAFLAKIAAECSKHDPEAFKWMIHTFLAIFFAFVLTTIFCPSTIMSASDRLQIANEKSIEESKNGEDTITEHSAQLVGTEKKLVAQVEDRPFIVLLALGGCLLAYMVYQDRKR